MDSIEPTRKSPFLRLISIALEIWIKNQCIYIENIKIEIKGSILKIISGTIEGLKLKASRINFKEIHIDQLNLLSSPISISLSNKDKKGIINPQEFNIKGELILSEENINKIFSSSSWQWLYGWFSEDLIASSEPFVLEIKNNSLYIKPIPNKKDHKTSLENLHLKADKETLLFKSVNTGKTKRLPMDPSIKIKSAEIKENKIWINFQSKVKI